ncbi:intraflagellar transport protein 27 homolog [Limulus polyphemus]|uniref:Intraflagellar transport protein 27 homolog n=1 Tax=Limulus polyphemus TaxID=6850 RepID=A0ABM1B8E7_LIMPO|nr:intraflagellar transport protein 27 homolog [Limulus polyphemus]
MSNILRSKCLVVGDSAVGKTALIQVFNSDNTFYPKNYTMTCGVDLVVKTVNVPDTNDVVELYFYDSSGKETYLDMMQKLWHNPSMWALVFDVTNEDSFNNMSSWLQKLQDLKPAVPPTERHDWSRRTLFLPGKRMAQTICRTN